MRKLGGTVVMNIHAGVFPVNQSKRAEGGFMSPVVHFAVEGMCANSGSGHSITNLCCILFSAIFINGVLFLPADYSVVLSTVYVSHRPFTSLQKKKSIYCSIRSMSPVLMCD